MMAMIGGRHRRWGSDFGGDGPQWGGRHRHGPGGRGRVFGGGELRLFLLSLLADQPRHGYELIKAIEELTGGNYAPSPGVVYPTLNLLTDEDLIAEQAGEGARKAYAATEAGRAEIASRREEIETITSRLRGLADDHDRHGAPPLRRAMGNLFTAVRQRAASGDFDRDTMLAVADILDEAARKIERL
ncbi:PadR family transcriptional regulator [Novosphingobium sp.]|uniref:PadR family transcriptional regulator n=1 Tax=Novosphingobium sp. TaxID=1874826 RepID=UPI0025E6A2A9|nr:PadR family transcriptional regulator [Novosphingobium sp.]